MATTVLFAATVGAWFDIWDVVWQFETVAILLAMACSHAWLAAGLSGLAAVVTTSRYVAVAIAGSGCGVMLILVNPLLWVAFVEGQRLSWYVPAVSAWVSLATVGTAVLLAGRSRRFDSRMGTRCA